VPEPQPAKPPLAESGVVRAASERVAPAFPGAQAVPGPPVPASEPESALGSLETAGGSPTWLELAAAVVVAEEEG
jgi:hypothetical protein